MKPRNQAGPHRPPPSAVGIRADELLPIRALHERLGWGPRTVAKAQRDGLRVLKYAKWAYVTGADVLAFLAGPADSKSDGEAILPREKTGSNGERCKTP